MADGIIEFDSLRRLFNEYVPSYKSRTFRPFVISFKWDRSVVDMMRGISEARCENRVESYIIPGELERVKDKRIDSCAIRFGHKKRARAGGLQLGRINGKRGDFCLIGGTIKGKALHVFYRSIDLIGGLHYDTAIFEHIEESLDIRFRRIVIYAPQAFVAAIPKNSNEKLFHRLKELYKR